MKQTDINEEKKKQSDTPKKIKIKDLNQKQILE